MTLTERLAAWYVVAMLTNFVRTWFLVVFLGGATGCLTGPADPGSPDAGSAGNPCVDCHDEYQCGGTTCSREGAICGFTSYCSYVNPLCTCSGGRFHCTYSGCFTCTPSADADTASATFHVTALSVSHLDGFNLDGINNAKKPGGLGATIAGCGPVDAANGVDNALEAVATSLTGTVDLNAALTAFVLPSAPDAGTTGAATLDVAVDHLVGSGVLDDRCLGVAVTLGLPGAAAVTVHGNGSMNNDVLTASLDLPLRIEVPLAAQLPAASCAGGTCQPASLALTLRGVRLRLTLDPTHQMLLPGSLLGGYAFVADADPTYATLEAEGIAASLASFATQAGADALTASTLLAAFTNARDLHAEPDGSLTPAGCNGTSTTMTNANSVSLAISLGAAAP